MLERAAVGRSLLPVILVSLAVKCLLAWRFPWTGDEAYFVLCGKYIAWGYYDHPPMTAWLLHLLLYLGHSALFLRLLPILVSTAVGVGLYALLRPYDEHKAYLVFVLFMISPINFAFFVVTTDTPIFLFCFLSAVSLFKAEKEHSYLWYMLSGVFLGLAFLSKYFAMLLGLSYLVYFLSVRKDARKTKGFLLLALGTIPFVAQNAVWNYQTGWPNIMHNWFNRFGHHSSPAINLLCLGPFLIYLMTPGVIYFLFKNRARVLRDLQKENTRLFVLASLVPLCVFVIVSFKKIVGPHWYVPFLPFAYVMVAFLLDPQQIAKSIKPALVVSLVQVSLVFAVSFVPVGKLKGLAKETDLASLVMYLYPQRVLQSLEVYGDDFILATKSYSISALLEYYRGDRVIVFGKGSHHARQDDILTNFKELEGRNILILRRATADPNEYRPCFDKLEIKPLKVEEATFSLLFGYGFRYQEYRQRYLLLALRAYYQIPDWLPYSKSFFHEKYDF